MATDPEAIRRRLHALAVAAGVHRAAVDAIPADDLPDYADLSDATLRELMRLRGACPTCCPAPAKSVRNTC